MAKSLQILTIERRLKRHEEPPSKTAAIAFAKMLRASVIRKYRRRVSLSALPFVSETITPYQWRWRGVRVIGFYDIGHFRDEGFYLRADTFVKV